MAAEYGLHTVRLAVQRQVFVAVKADETSTAMVATGTVGGCGDDS